MANIRDFLQSIKDKQAFNSIYMQMFIIVIAFLIMGISSFNFASRIERNNLLREVESALALTESELNANLLEPETFLSSYSEVIRSMLLNNENETTITAFMTNMTASMTMEGELMSGLINTHGYLTKWGGKYFSVRDRIPPYEISSQGLPWYQPAVDARGKIVISSPFRDIYTGSFYLTFSRVITDNNGDPLAVICIDIDISNFSNHAFINLTKNSYGILLNEKQEILAHQNRSLLGLKLHNTTSDMALYSFYLETGRTVYNERVRNRFSNSIIYIIEMKYGWYFGISIPENEYYMSITYMAVFLIIIGLILSFALCALVYNISQTKLKSDLRTQQKSNFLATMSHEIRTPLNAILGMTEIQIQSSNHPVSTSDAFIRINNSGKLLLNIINDILDLSKIESGKLELVPVKYEVASLINDIIQLNNIRYEDKPIKFNIEIDENIPAILVGDELRIKQVMNNLLSNAFKYTDQGTVTLAVNAECVGRGGGAVIVTLIFRVEDTGQGMTPEQVNKLFDEYTRFNLEANRTTEGAGLGMTITRNFVDLMYGKITVNSIVGKGTSITVRLPQKTDGVGIRGVLGKDMVENLKQFRHDNSIQLKKSKIEYEYMPYGSVLIVDDVETNLYVAKGLMIPYGLKIDLATCGIDAIKKVKEGNVYDIVFMDHMMPKMDGIETTKNLRDTGYTRPIVALTANAIAGQMDMFLSNGFDDFISKPIDIRLLNVLLNKLIRDKQTREVLEAACREKEELDKKPDKSSKSQDTDKQLSLVFARDAEKAINVIKTCMSGDLRDESNLQMYIINVHAMKSALANIREKDLSFTAGKLEQAGRDNDINVLTSGTQEFINNIERIIEEIKINNKDNETCKDEDTEESLVLLNEKLEIIRESCAVLDKKTAKKALGELRDKTWSQKTKDLIDAIAGHLLHSDFDNIISLAEKYKNDT